MPPSSEPPDEGEAPEDVAAQLTVLTRGALLEGDAHALERWCNGLQATGEREKLAERMRAMADLSHGQTARAVLVLRRASDELEAEGASPAQRCQAALALSLGLAHAGHADEALLHALHALARAREGSDALGEKACVSFLVKLLQGVSREREADRLRETILARSRGYSLG
jgi:hypothetical protein